MFCAKKDIGTLGLIESYHHLAGGKYESHLSVHDLHNVVNLGHRDGILKSILQ